MLLDITLDCIYDPYFKIVQNVQKCSPPFCNVVAIHCADDDLGEDELDLEELGDVHGDGEGHDGEEVLHQAPPQLPAVVHRLVMSQRKFTIRCHKILSKLLKLLSH